MVLSKSLTPEEDEAFRVMFAQAEDHENRNFTILHEIVPGLTQSSLADELETQTTDIDAQDSIGLTALAMAAKHGDAESIKVHLVQGVDSNIPSHSGKDALCYAAKKNDLACVTLLVNGGAKVTNRRVYQQTALDFTALHYRDERFVDLLLNAGADMNAVDRDRRTPLGFTPLHNNVDFASYLLNKGATIRCPGSPPAVDPLIQAIRANRHELLDLFVEHGFDIDLPLPKGQTLLHIITEWADEETMDILSRCKFGHLHVGKTDDEGLTSLDIVRLREEDSHAMTQYFLKMLESSLSDGIQGDDELKSTSGVE
jgi:ankyrin repeat protein